MKYVDKVVKKGNAVLPFSLPINQPLANEIIKKFDETITIPYSHFMTNDLNPEWFACIWKYSIVPEVEDIIEEEDSLQYLIDLPSTLSPFNLSVREE